MNKRFPFSTDNTDENGWLTLSFSPKCSSNLLYSWAVEGTTIDRKKRARQEENWAIIVDDQDKIKGHLKPIFSFLKCVAIELQK